MEKEDDDMLDCISLEGGFIGSNLFMNLIRYNQL